MRALLDDRAISPLLIKLQANFACLFGEFSLMTVCMLMKAVYQNAQNNTALVASNGARHRDRLKEALTYDITITFIWNFIGTVVVLRACQLLVRLIPTLFGPG